MFLGIEIGGTKLQLGVGAGDGSKLVAVERRAIRIEEGAEGILKQIEEVGQSLVREYRVRHVGIGFGGPVDPSQGRVIKSFQVPGWENHPLAAWCQKTLAVPVILANDCDAAALAEARFGAGRGRRIVFYVTVGTGIGGGLVVDGHPHGGGRPAVAEIGQLRPGLDAVDPTATVERLSAGPAIERAAQARLTQSGSHDALHVERRDLQDRCGDDTQALTAKVVGEAASAGNRIAKDVLDDAIRPLGWAIAQTLTLTAAEIVVVGGGVSLLGERLFFAPLRKEVARYVFPPLKDSYAITAAELGELVVVHGAVTIASRACS